MIEIVFEIFGEFLFQVVFTMLGELFSGAVGSGFSSIAKFKPPPLLKGLLYLLAGMALGWVSLKIFPHAFTRLPDTRLAVLIGSPLACGGIMGLFGAWRSKRKKADMTDMFSPRSFMYGLVFALPMALARFIWAT